MNYLAICLLMTITTLVIADDDKTSETSSWKKFYPYSNNTNKNDDYEDEKSTGSKTTSKTTQNISYIYQPATTSGRLLASNCFQCHGTNGMGGFERISGGEASEVYDYLGKKLTSDIMATHAQSYSQQQLESIIGYLNQISK